MHKNTPISTPSKTPKHTLHTDELLEVLHTGQKPLCIDMLLRILGLPRKQKKHVENLLYILAQKGKVIRMRGGSWAITRTMKHIVGQYRVQRSGIAFVDITPQKQNTADKKNTCSREAHRQAYSVRIPFTQHNGAWHGDTVKVALFPSAKQSVQDRTKRVKGREKNYVHAQSTNRLAEGRIIEIVQRHNKELAVRIVRQQSTVKNKHHTKIVLCEPIDARFPFLVHVDCSTLPEAVQEGDMLLVRPVYTQDCVYTQQAEQWTRQQAEKHNRKKHHTENIQAVWSATALSFFGQEAHVSVQETLVKLCHQAPTEFSTAALEETYTLPSVPCTSDMQGRTDMRHIPFVTIDGEDARDFDDAIYVEKNSQGWCLYVGIADVTHYVRPHSALDIEARQRGNSWYFPCSVEPMLPKALSHGLCSLKPHENRLVMLAELHIDSKGHVLQTHFMPAVIRSAARLTYDTVKHLVIDNDAQARTNFINKQYSIDSTTIEIPAQEKHILSMLEQAKTLAEILLQCRNARGALDFMLPEAQYIFDKNGYIVNIIKKERHFAHQIIEECMIAANEAVARFLEEKNIPFLYRVHPEPEQTRLESLFRTLASTPFAEKLPSSLNAAALQNILHTAQGEAQEFLVGRLTLRTMPQARYGPENEYHFGLASTAYCHFTSPIRRYADIIVHRALKYALTIETQPILTEKELYTIGDALNKCERAAIDAEREIARRLAILVLQGREGEGFSGIISGVSDFGIFVELDTMPIEGMVHIRDLGDDYFVYNPERQELIGHLTKIRYTLGQAVQTRLTSAHMGKLEISLALVRKKHKTKTHTRNRKR